jgi:inorganic pyrophosphatase
MRRRLDHRPATPEPLCDCAAITCVVEHPRGHPTELRGEPRLAREWQSADGVPHPADHGFIPGTLGRSGDPLVALVLGWQRSMPGELVFADPVAMVDMQSANGSEQIIICTSLAHPPETAEGDVADFGSGARERINAFLTSVHPAETIDLVWGNQREAAIAVVAARWLFEDTDHAS